MFGEVLYYTRLTVGDENDYRFVDVIPAQYFSLPDANIIGSLILH